MSIIIMFPLGLVKTAVPVQCHGVPETNPLQGKSFRVDTGVKRAKMIH